MNGTKEYLDCPKCRNQYPKYPLVVFCICGTKLEPHIDISTRQAIKDFIWNLFPGGKEDENSIVR